VDASESTSIGSFVGSATVSVEMVREANMSSCRLCDGVCNVIETKG
jgi:hypothetical protein